MIYDDVLEFLLKDSSSKEIDVILFLLNNKNWNNIVHIDPLQLANETGTTVRYIKEILIKLNKDFKRRKAINIIEPFEKVELLLGKTSILYQKGERYTRKFPFLFSRHFQELNIYSKRIILKAAEALSFSKQKVSFISLNTLTKENDLGFKLIPSKKDVINAISAINNSFDNMVSVNIVSNTYTKDTYLKINFDKELINESLHNLSERFLLNKKLFESGFHEKLPVEHSIELEKVGHYLFSALTDKALIKHRQQEGEGRDLLKDSLELAREIYNNALEKLAPYISSNNFTEKNPKEISAYFSSILYTEATERLIILEQRKITYESVLEKIIKKASEKGHQEETELSVVSSEHTYVNVFSEILLEWMQEWLRPRINKKGISSANQKERALIELNNLREFFLKSTSDFKRKVLKYGNKALSEEQNLEFLNTFKESVLNFIDPSRNRLKELNATHIF